MLVRECGAICFKNMARLVTVRACTIGRLKKERATFGSVDVA